jgi:pimeloyl-ACP methyl ester carboxylesterase
MPAESNTPRRGQDTSRASVAAACASSLLTGRDASAPTRVETTEGRLAFHALGDATDRPPLVLLHGFTGHRDDFVGVMPALARERRVIAPDLRGHGDSASRPGQGGFSLDQLAQDLTALLDALGIARIDLLGHSVGGLVAQRFALAHPDRLRSLVLMCTAPAPPTRMDPEGWRRACVLAERDGMRALQRRSEEVARAHPSPGLSAWRDPERYFLHHRRRFGAMTPESYRGVGEAFFGAASMLDRLGEIGVPALVLVGELDEDWLPGAEALAGRLPDVRHVIVPGAEHHPHQENPAVFLAEVAAHLQRVEAKAQERDVPFRPPRASGPGPVRTE